MSTLFGMKPGEDTAESSSQIEMLGKVRELWRYPVKSMQGESIDQAELTELGFVGDRMLALLDVVTGRIASAKSPRMWPNLLEFRAKLTALPTTPAKLPAVEITMPDGKTLRTDDPDVESVLSTSLGREVKIVSSNPPGATYEQYVPPVEDAEPDGSSDYYRDIPNSLLGSGTLHDAASVHLLTDATLNRLKRLYPTGDFDVRRFRPNVVVSTGDGEPDFVENGWLKQTIALGGAAVRVTAPMLRCVMTTRPQGSLPKDLGILRTPAQHNRLPVLNMGSYPCVGVAALVNEAGVVRLGDDVRMPG